MIPCEGDKVRVVKTSSKPAKASPEKLPWPRTSEPDENGEVVQVGVDVRAKMPDITKIVHKYFRVAEVPMEELLQEVYVAIIHKNHTKSAHDPRKSSFGHYVFMIANNVCINIVHRQKRFEKERESIDTPSGHEDSRTLLDTVDASLSQNQVGDSVQRLQDVEDVMRRHGLRDLARYVRAVRSGAKPDVVKEALTWGDRKMSNKVIRDLRAQIRDIVSGFSYSEASRDVINALA